MDFNKHLELEGRHAFLGASKYSWLNYDLTKLDMTYKNHQKKMHGTVLHEFAATAIKLRIPLEKTNQTLNLFVNDAIGFKMTPEQPLYYSQFCFGTADAILFKDKMLRIHDLKTGVSLVSMNQLYIYAALFCLEYNVNPKTIDIELRIYQNDTALIDVPDKEVISGIMGQIVVFDKHLQKIHYEE